MNAAIHPRRADGFVRFLSFLLAAGVLVPTFLVVSVTRYIRLGSETAALRDSVLAVAPAKKRVVVNVGGMTIGLARIICGFIDLPEEARTGIGAARAAEVGVYQIENSIPVHDRGVIVQKADQAMRKRGWERIVGVAKDQELVAVYIPQKGFSEKKVRCCVLVVHDRELVVAAARANASGVLELVRKQMGQEHPLLPPLVANL